MSVRVRFPSEAQKEGRAPYPDVRPSIIFKRPSELKTERHHERIAEGIDICSPYRNQISGIYLEHVKEFSAYTY